MNKTIIHMSDLHFRQNWHEDQGVVLDEFFKDLGKQLETLDRKNVYFVFSGDFVLKGGEQVLYDDFFTYFNNKLSELDIQRNKRICVPGNHDISRSKISDDLANHEAIIAHNLTETQFNTYISQPTNNILLKKFDNYKAFELKFADMGIASDMMSGVGHIIDKEIGVYCLNTAFCSSGGIDKDGKTINDLNRLAIDTRSLQEWNTNCKVPTKILVMHHPISWLTEWAQKELRIILDKDFSLCLSGHNHEQTVLHSMHKHSSLVECSAPALLTNKHDDLGYSILTVGPRTGVIELKYRQWTKHRTFVSGVDFSNTDNGIIEINKNQHNLNQENLTPNKSSHDLVTFYLNSRLEDALTSFQYQPKVWVEPVLNSYSETKLNDGHEHEPPVVLADFISNPTSTIIRAFPQFGKTCLSYYLCKEAWVANNAHWVYLDAAKLKPHTIMKSINAETKLLDYELKDIKCIVLDSWSSSEKNSRLTLQKLCATFENIPIIVMQSIGDTLSLNDPDTEPINRSFSILYLWSLSRNQVRKIVTEYNAHRYVGDIDSVITKIVSDLEVLNLHRTPLSCLTLLKAWEVDFDESPVNRTEMIKRVLFILFNIDDLPTYKTRPDLKDCEYVLGYFCELLIRENIYTFTREQFLHQLEEFCKAKIINLEVQIVFDILHQNHILVNSGNSFAFRFSYWIYYFAAQRMHQDSSFADYIFEDLRYTSFPEIIEFYTGIDRRREDALNILYEDIENIYDIVDEKVGFNVEINPYKHAKWISNEESIKKMRGELSDGVKDSKLPDEVKDFYADNRYDRSRPYNQNIQTVLREYSLKSLIRLIRAGARALRNSDYADPEIKRKLLQKLIQSWCLVSNVVMIISPALADEGEAQFDGQFFVLVNFGDDPKERLNAILRLLPINTVSWFKDDLYSHKMGPLLVDKLANSITTDLERHYLQLVLIIQRPPGWKAQVQDYINSVPKDSFYLLDVFDQLRLQYKFSYASPQTLEDIKYLIKMALAKHEGSKNPGIQAVNKISDKVLPERKVE